MHNRWIIAILAAVGLLAAGAAPAGADPVMSDGYTYDVSVGDPPADPDPVRVGLATGVSFSDTLDASEQNEELPPAEVDYCDYTLDAGDGIILSAAGFSISEDKHTATRHVEAAILGTVSASVKFNDYGEKGVSLSGSVTFTDESGLSDSAAATVRVWAITSIKVRRTESGNDFTSVCTVAAGGKGPDEHKADVEVRITPALEGVAVDSPVIASDEGEGVHVDASIGGGGVTDSQGRVELDAAYQSSDLGRSVTIQAAPGTGSGTAAISQAWNQYGYPWECDPYFLFGWPAYVSFHPKLVDGETYPPIRSHDLLFKVTSAVVWHWNPDLLEGEGDYEVKTYTSAPSDPNAGLLASLAGFNPEVSGDVGEGTYDSSLTVSWNIDEIVDSVWFRTEDQGAFEW